MLTIRAEQLETLRERSKGAFIAKEVRRLTEDHPEMNPAPDEGWIRRRMDEAGEFGIMTESDIVRYNDLAVTSGEGFPDDEDRRTLERDDLWGWQKLDALEADRIFSNGHPMS